MGTEVLRPQDFFNDRFRLSPTAFYRRKTCAVNGNGFVNQRSNNNYYGHRKPVLPRPERSDHKKKIQQDQQLHLPLTRSAPPPPQPPQQSEQQQLLLPRRSSSAGELQNNPIRVTILRRRQSLDTIDASRMKRDTNNKARGSLVKNYMDEDDDVYAGSAFFVSPSPSSLPLPSFFNNNNNNNNNNSMDMDNNHTTINKKDHFQHSATRDLRRLLRLE